MNRTRWQRFKFWFFGECAREGCENYANAQLPLDRKLCNEHAQEQWDETSRKIRRMARDREIEIQAEALKRTLPDALRQAREEDG